MNRFGRLNQIGMKKKAMENKARELREKYNLGYDMKPKCKAIVEDENMIAARKEIENMSFEEYNNLPTYKG